LFRGSLSKLDFETGELPPPITAVLPSDGRSGKSPQTISATKDPDRYLVSNVMDHSRGLSTLVIERDGDGNVMNAAMNAMDLSQPGNQVRVDRLNIQRAQSSVLVKYQDMEYAIVADDNYNFNDAYWKAMFEAPMFLFPPLGPPIAIGGSASARRVAVGGKLGIIQDPFGTPKFLGATLPLDGYGIINLSVSQDGKVLLGQLKGGYGTLDQLRQKAHQSQAWSVEAIIQAALNHKDEERLTKHIVLPANVASQVPTNTTAPVGTKFNNMSVTASMQGRMGDIIEVDLKRQIAHAILGLPAPSDDQELSESQESKIAEIMSVLSKFSIKPGQEGSLTGPDRAMTLVAKGGAESIESRILSGDGGFSTSGMMYLAPNITDKDLADLRSGKPISAGKTQKIEISFELDQDVTKYAVFGIPLSWLQKGTGSLSLTVTAKDYATAANTFFGDRPLDNPGYSAIKLKNQVAGSSADTIDVWRIEQRLRYLGFSAVGYQASPINNTPQDFDVDGQFGQKEVLALKQFQRLVNGVVDGAVDINGAAIKWLNAYNAPHWMDIGSQMQYQGLRLVQLKQMVRTRLPVGETRRQRQAVTR
jgi:hypothetical protein